MKFEQKDFDSYKYIEKVGIVDNNTGELVLAIDDVLSEVDDYLCNRVPLNVFIEHARVFSSNTFSDEGPGFIAPNGTFYFFADSDDDTHHRAIANIAYWYVNEKYEDVYGSCFIDFAYDIEYEIQCFTMLDDFCENLNLVRVNSGTTEVENRFYTVVLIRMSALQKISLEDFINWGKANGKDEVLVFVGTNGTFNRFGLNRYDAEEIVDKISDAFVRGAFIEHVKKARKKLLPESFQSVDSLGTELTQAQTNFFRNSKIRDEKGRLLVCYHGTKNPGFTKFNPKDSESQFGKYKFNKNNITYFTTEKKTAIGYTNIGIEEDGNVYACYLNITNPYIVDNETDSDIRSWKNIKDKKIREKQIQKFETEYQYWKAWADEDTDIEDINEWLRLFNVELRPSEDYDDCYDLWELEKNTQWGTEHVVIPAYTLEELFDDDMYEEFRDAVIGDYESEEYGDDYYLDIDTIIRWVLFHNSIDRKNQYDGIIVSDILDVGPTGSPFDGNTTDIVSFDPSQIKSINNQTPTNSVDINEEQG